MSNLFEYAEKTRTIPETSSWKGYINTISVEAAATMIVELTLKRNSINSEHGLVHHMYEASEVEIELSDLGAHMRRSIGETLRVISMSHWIDTVARAGLNPLLVAYLQRIDREKVFFLRLLLK
ncbi:hypothetical protein GGR53DRAFT_110629 [Hypoxylon sp. FL1150]|nr:hypothetical protein GGR53DRAFT_110629 [Hypoxylon sp. FL1150]